MTPFFIDLISISISFCIVAIVVFFSLKMHEDTLPIPIVLILSSLFLSTFLGAFLCDQHRWVNVTDKLCYSSEMFSEEKTCKVYTEDPFRDSTRSVTQRTWSWKEEKFKNVTIFKRIKTGFGMEYSNDLEPDLKIIPLEVPYE